MEHDEAASLLPDHLEGRLSGPTRVAVEEHAAACADCQALSESYRVLAEGFRAEEAGEVPGHPSVEELVDFALGRGESAGARRAELTAHLRSCAPCSLEVEAVRRSQAEVQGTHGALTARRGWGLGAALRSPFAAPLAASILLLILAYPAFLGVRELPRVREESKALLAGREARVEELVRSLERSETDRRRLASWTGAVTVPLLAPPVRGGAPGETVIPLAEGQPFVCLAVDPGVPDRDTSAGSYFVEVVKPDGSTAWSLELDPPEVRRQMTQAGSLAFLVPSEQLPPARYRLKIARRGPAGERRLLEVAFALVRQE